MANSDEQQRIQAFKAKPFMDGPTEALVNELLKGIAAVPQFKRIFGAACANYEREDWSMRELPALRIYSTAFRKEHESHYIMGTVTLDVLFPVSLRREETQYLQDVISAALLQQLRRPTFFAAMQAVVPGLNELGKTFDVDKGLGLKLGDNILPMTQTNANFRLDLKAWDDYLSSKGRTKDDPFEVTIGDLETIAGIIEARNDDGSVALTISTEQTAGEDADEESEE